MSLVYATEWTHVKHKMNLFFHTSVEFNPVQHLDVDCTA